MVKIYFKQGVISRQRRDEMLAAQTWHVKLLKRPINSTHALNEAVAEQQNQLLMHGWLWLKQR